jgi:hypothetical protein
MRYDMAKLLTEAERYGSSNPSQKWGKRLKYDSDSDYEDEVTRVSMSRKKAYGYDCKTLSDVLNPLKGYLRKNLGRLWDDIYSELCQNLDRRSVSGNHVFQHIWDYVAKRTYVGVDDDIYERHISGWSSPVDGYYIHPWTGILSFKERPSRRTERRERVENAPVISIRISDIGRCELIDGIWYYLENWKVEHTATSSLKPWRLRFKVIEVEGMPPLYEYTWVEDFSTKRQLNKKELKKLGIKNEQKFPSKLSRRERKRLSPG